MIAKIKQRWLRLQRDRYLRKQFASLASFKREIFSTSLESEDQDPILVFNASTRITGLSLNAAFSLLTSWGLRLEGIPVVYLVCEAGMTRCVLGTNLKDPQKKPPCKECTIHSQVIYDEVSTYPIKFSEDAEFDQFLENLTLDQLVQFEYAGIPIGQLVLPSIRWILRRHNLHDDERTHLLYREYLHSAWNIAQETQQLLSAIHPRAVIVFNGMFFPEAMVKWIATREGIRVISHEVGLLPMTGFFTDGEATAYPISIPDEFQLDSKRNERLDRYLAKRFQGDFSMAGIRFWSNMETIDPSLKERIDEFDQMIPVFTNVIFDTSQPHSNVVFGDMFHWLETVIEIALDHPKTLFIIRAHPDEHRTGKESQESVRQWVWARGLENSQNIHFIDSHEVVSSYGLIQAGKFSMVYNSSIGLEASILGKAVLCGGKARFTQLPTVFFPLSIDDYREKADALLAAETIHVPEEFKENARRFLYYQLFRVSLPFGKFLKKETYPGFVSMDNFPISELRSSQSETMRVLNEGILSAGSFVLAERPLSSSE
jgi:hypothetical protein